MENAAHTIDLNSNKIKSETQRFSGLELLRILAMFMIVLHHAFCFSNALYPDLTTYKLSRILACGGKLGVNIFVLISAYFMIDKKFSSKRIIKLILNMFIVSWLILIIFLITGYKNYSLIEIFISLFPILWENWWFLNTYLILMLISPGLNIIIKNLTQKQHKMICIISLILLIGFPYINFFVFNEFMNLSNYSNLLWFVELYFIAAYFKLYNVKCSITNLILLLTIGALYQSLSTAFFKTGIEVSHPNALGNVILAIGMFLLFNKLKFKNKFINAFAGTMLGVYMIHEHTFFRGWWWVNAYRAVNSVLNNCISTYLTLSVITFVLCAVIYFVYYKLIYLQLIKLLNKLKVLQ